LLDEEEEIDPVRKAERKERDASLNNKLYQTTHWTNLFLSLPLHRFLIHPTNYIRPFLHPPERQAHSSPSSSPTASRLLVGIFDVVAFLGLSRDQKTEEKKMRQDSREDKFSSQSGSGRDFEKLTSIPCSHSHLASPSKITTLPSGSQNRCSTHSEDGVKRRRRRKEVPERRERERMGVSYRWGRST